MRTRIWPRLLIWCEIYKNWLCQQCKNEHTHYEAVEYRNTHSYLLSVEDALSIMKKNITELTLIIEEL